MASSNAERFRFSIRASAGTRHSNNFGSLLPVLVSARGYPCTSTMLDQHRERLRIGSLRRNLGRQKRVRDFASGCSQKDLRNCTRCGAN